MHKYFMIWGRDAEKALWKKKSISKKIFVTSKKNANYKRLPLSKILKSDAYIYGLCINFDDHP